MRAIPLPAWITAAAAVVFAASWASAPADAWAPAPRAVSATPASAPPPRPHDGLPELPVELPAPQPDGAPPRRVLSGFQRTYKVAFTFDDGPHPTRTARVLDVLARHRIRAAFFVNGKWLDVRRPDGMVNREVLLRARSEGHLIGNHTFSHAALDTLTPDQQTWEIVANEVLLTNVTGVRTTLFRAPYGRMTRHARQVLRRYGYVLARWNAAADAEGHRSPTAIASEVLGWITANRGGIVLLHDRHRGAARALELILAGIHRESCARAQRNLPTFQVVSLDALLAPGAQSRKLAGTTPPPERPGRPALAHRCQEGPRRL